MAACGDDQTSADAASGSSAVAAAVHKTSATGFAFTLVSGHSRERGEYDADSKGLKLIDPPDTVVVVEGKMFVKGFPGPHHDQWVEIPVLDRQAKAWPADPVQTLLFLSGVRITASRTDARTYKGSLDLTHTTLSGRGRQLVAELAKQLGRRANNVPFAATINADGYLTRWHVRFPGLAGHGRDEVFDMRLSDYGPHRVRRPPPSQTIPISKL